MASSANYPSVSYQPIRLLYQLGYSTSILLRLPLWVVVSLVPALRPHGQWTFRQTLMARLSRAAVDMVSTIGITETVSLAPGREGDRFQLLEPGPDEAYQGPLTEHVVRPATIGGTWYPARPGPGASGLKVALHLHGGAFVMGHSRPNYNGFFATTLLEQTGFDAVLAVTYRLSGYGGANPFPAALQDTLTAYLHLTRTLGLAPAQIVLVGDSAGGNLVLALVRYLETFGRGLGLPDQGRPSCALLVSPWVNPLAALGPDNFYTRSPHWSTDYVPVSFLRWGARTYGGEVLRSEPYVTPLGSPFATPVPMLVLFGEAEVLQTDGAKWVEEMKSVEGNRLEVHYEPSAVHDTLLLGSILGWEDSICATARKLGASIATMRSEQ